MRFQTQRRTAVAERVWRVWRSGPPPSPIDPIHVSAADLVLPTKPPTNGDDRWQRECWPHADPGAGLRASGGRSDDAGSCLLLSTAVWTGRTSEFVCAVPRRVQMSPSGNVLAIIPPRPTPTKFRVGRFDSGPALASWELAGDGPKANAKLLATESWRVISAQFCHGRFRQLACLAWHAPGASPLNERQRESDSKRFHSVRILPLFANVDRKTCSR
jgi:hypothetical protein